MWNTRKKKVDQSMEKKVTLLKQKRYREIEKEEYLRNSSSPDPSVATVSPQE